MKASIQRKMVIGKYYSSEKEVKSVVKRWFKEQSTEFYGAGIHAVIRRCKIVIERNGCVEIGM